MQEFLQSSKDWPKTHWQHLPEFFPEINFLKSGGWLLNLINLILWIGKNRFGKLFNFGFQLNKLTLCLLIFPDQIRSLHCYIKQSAFCQDICSSLEPGSFLRGRKLKLEDIDFRKIFMYKKKLLPVCFVLQNQNVCVSCHVWFQKTDFDQDVGWEPHCVHYMHSFIL